VQVGKAKRPTRRKRKEAPGQKESEWSALKQCLGDDFLAIRQDHHPDHLPLDKQSFDKDLSISEIVRQTGHSRVTVRKYLNSQVPPLTQKRSRKPTKLDDLREYIIDKLKECPLSASRIYREIQDRGLQENIQLLRISCMKSDLRSEFQRYTIRDQTRNSSSGWLGRMRLYRYRWRQKETLLFHHGSWLFANEICRISSANRRLFPHPMSHKCVWVFWRLSARSSIW
jgi:hypothetical protein